MVRDETILLVEDDPDDELLTPRTLKKNDVYNDDVVARDGAEALDYLCSPRARTGGAPERHPAGDPARPQAAQGRRSGGLEAP